METYRKPISGFKTGIRRQEVAQLLRYSKEDLQVKRFTNDSKRFSSVQAFRSWRVDKKVYTLTMNHTLVGITWFSKKRKYSKFPFNFAIRVYPPARGKGIATNFMESSFARFKKTKKYRLSKHKGFWLSTKKDNELAIRLYTKFGFKFYKNDLGDKIMVYIT